MSDLERLYFANGQRLGAPELRLEQAYHMGVRRLLTRGLFTPGVVDGLEVVADASKRSVVVSPGLALDPLGREVYLGEPRSVPVPTQTRMGLTPPGYYLTIRYDEQRLTADGDPCSAPGMIATIVLEAPLLEWTDEWPDHLRADQPGHERDAAIAIALVTLTSACEIEDVQTILRQYSHPTHASQVSSLSFEGEKDIDAANPKHLHFEISGGPPSAVVLALWGEKFSSVFYTELGTHGHALSAIPTSDTDLTLAAHVHSLSAHDHDLAPTASGQTKEGVLPGGVLGPDGWHNHDLLVSGAGDLGYPIARVPLNPGGSQRLWTDGFTHPFVGETTHTHTVELSGPTGAPKPDTTGPVTPPEPHASHHHTVTGHTDNTGTAGAPNIRTGAAYTFLEDLTIVLDGNDITNYLKQHLGWAHLGTGGADHQLNSKEGTGPVDLMLDLGLALEKSAHTLEFSVASGGGKLLYNLYVR